MQTRALPEYVSENKKQGNFLSSVGTTISRVFPIGTLAEQQLEGSNRWENPPINPEDIFAVVGVLLEDSGALSFHGIDNGAPHSNFPKLALSSNEIKTLEVQGLKWSNSKNSLPKFILNLWKELISYWDFPLNYRAYRFENHKTENEQFWWKPAYKLLVVSDSACNGIGFTPKSKHEKSFASEFWKFRAASILLHQKKASGDVKNLEFSSSLSGQADPDIVCVQPKSLVPTVGAGTRVFSKNLSLLRSRGLVRTQWAVNTQLPIVNADPGLNILIIPFPFDFGKNEFDITDILDQSTLDTTRVFKLRQTWLEDDSFSSFLSTCGKMVDESEEKHRSSIHAIVLPELALNKKRFLEFCVFIKQRAPKLEFVISGSSENCEITPKSGNYIWIRKFHAGNDGVHAADDNFFDVSQSKHHRWKLDGKQIRDYSLDHDIDGGLSEVPHWENFAGRPREVNFLSFRERSAMCGIICEDLARSEPCHEVIRSVGPNLMFGLLMDGPQIEQRWGARYASLFAEDHGCAIMTVSSRALVAKSQESREENKRNYSIAYFKSPNMAYAQPFECPHTDSGILIRLVPDQDKRGRPYRERQLIDGRTKEVVDWVIDKKLSSGRADSSKFVPIIVGLDRGDT